MKSASNSVDRLKCLLQFFFQFIHSSIFGLLPLQHWLFLARLTRICRAWLFSSLRVRLGIILGLGILGLWNGFTCAILVKERKQSWLSLISINSFLLSPAFSKKSGGTLFLVFRGAWRVVRGAWFRVFSGYFVPLTPPTVSVQSFWNFTGVLRMVWRYACGFFRILK